MAEERFDLQAKEYHSFLLLLRLLVMEAEVSVDGGKGDTLGLGDDVALVRLLDHLLDREGRLLLADLQEGRERLVADAPRPPAIAAVGGEQGLDLLAALAVAPQPVEDGGATDGGAFAERDLPFALAQLLQDLLLVAPGEPLLLQKREDYAEAEDGDLFFLFVCHRFLLRLVWVPP